MNLRTSLLAGLILATSLFYISCNRTTKDIAEPDTRINEYLVGYTTGTITRRQDIIVKFAKPVVTEDRSGSVVDSKIFSINPSVIGTSIWSDPQTLVFTPELEYEWGKDYSVNINLVAAFGDPTVKEFKFNVNTVAKNFGVEVLGLSLSDENQAEYKLEIILNTSDHFITDEIESIIAVTQEKTVLVPVWDHDISVNVHTFIVKGIKRGEKEGVVKILWDGKKIGVNNNGSQEVKVPSISEFKITSWRVVNTPSQYLTIEFSDMINEKTEMNGLVMIDGKSISSITRTGNSLNIFTPSRLTGNHSVTVDGTLSNSFNYTLGVEVTFIVDFGGVKPGVRLTGNGVIVPQTEGLIFPFEAVNLKSVDIRITKIFSNNIHYFLQENNMDGGYELGYFGRNIKRTRVDLKSDGRMIDYGKWNAFSIDLANYIDVEPGAIYRVEIGFRKSYSLFPCEADADTDKFYTPIEEEGGAGSREYEDVFYDHYYNWQERETPCNQAYYSPDKFVVRNILGSNFGMIAKRDAAGKMNVIVTNLKNATPEPDVMVEAFDLQNQKLASVKTDNDGFAYFTAERNVFLLVARKNRDIGYLKTQDGGSLSMSNFEVSGQANIAGTKGFIYGERGVWRPGDSVYVAFILEDKQKWLPDGHPIIFELYDTRGQMVKRMTTVKTDRVIYPFWFTTGENDATGNWNARVRVGGTEFNKRIRIETVKPNRLKINLEFEDEILIGEKTYRAQLNAKWLHGTPASGMKAKIGATFAEIGTSFEKYREYIFDAPFEEPWFPEMDVFESSLDNEGKATVNFNFEPNDDVNEMLRATFITRVFEPGGDFSINRITKNISPFTKYVGFSIPWSNAKYQKLNTDESHEFPIVTVDQNGSPINATDITVKVFKLEWRYWWSRSGENLASYNGRTYHKPVFDLKVNTSGGTGSFNVSVPKGNWGRYLILVNLPGGNVAGKVVFFDWPWGRKESAGGADILNVTTDKDTYMVGEEVTVSFPAAASSNALLTLESGSTVLRQEWVREISETTTWKFTATAEMTPNVYVHVSLLNPHDETANDLPIRMYGIAPVMVEDPDSHLEPVLEMPDKLKPETEFRVRVSEKSGKAMEYTLAVVDEGLLDLTGFRTPDPWPQFYQKEALGVRTWDMYMYVLGAYGGKLERMFAIGGDESATDPTKNKQKRFEPVVKVLGPFLLEKGKSMEHKITLPQYVGSVRTMVVAANGYAYGKTEKAVPVNNPVMVLGTLPRVLAPGEKIKLPVSVFVMEEGLTSVNIEVETNNMLIASGPKSQVLKVDKPGEFDIEFEFTVAGSTGQAKVDIRASAGKESGRHEIFIEVRNPNPPETKGELKRVEAGASMSINMDAFGIPGSNSGKVEISGMLPLNLESRLGYLMRYPHGCIEQTTSAVFPQLYLSRITQLDKDQMERISSNVITAIEKLRRFQMPDGGMSFWPGGNYGSDWGTIYAAHFLLQAEKAGYGIPAAMKSKLMNWIKNYTNSYRFSSTVQYKQITQSYALFVLSMAGEPSQGAMNRMRERKDDLEFMAKWYLSGAYALSGRKEVAYELADMRDFTPKRSYYETYGTIHRDKGVILNILALLEEDETGFRLAKEISEELSGGRWMSTQTTAWCLIALSEFFGDYSTDQPLTFSLSVDGKSETYSSKSFINEYKVNNDKSGGAMVEVKNSGANPIYVFASWTGTPKDVNIVEESRGIEMLVNYKDKSGRAIDPSSLTQGSDFIVEVAITNRSAVRAEDLALTQIFPSGWEILNTRLFEGSSVEQNGAFDYQDIRDDRVYTYFDLQVGKTVSFNLNITASYDGEYILPAFVCEGMYDNSFFAISKGRKVKVVKE
ncbi:MAG: hypothetical protein E4G95_00520 [Bacteroidia bacterium]|nr:MAG: hypothetical protein E4G95_00520 [Bacteroidia bacterium]